MQPEGSKYWRKEAMEDLEEETLELGRHYRDFNGRTGGERCVVFEVQPSNKVPSKELVRTKQKTGGGRANKKWDQVRG